MSIIRFTSKTQYKKVYRIAKFYYIFLRVWFRFRSGLTVLLVYDFRWEEFLVKSDDLVLASYLIRKKYLSNILPFFYKLKKYVNIYCSVPEILVAGWTLTANDIFNICAWPPEIITEMSIINCALHWFLPLIRKFDYFKLKSLT